MSVPIAYASFRRADSLVCLVPHSTLAHATEPGTEQTLHHCSSTDLYKHPIDHVNAVSHSHVSYQHTASQLQIHLSCLLGVSGTIYSKNCSFTTGAM